MRIQRCAIFPNVLNKNMNILILLIAFIAVASAQKFVDVLLDIGNAAVKPWIGQECAVPNQWSTKISTPDDEKSKFFFLNLGNVDVFSHVGLEFGCHQLEKEFGLAAEAKKTHTIAYGGSFTPISMFTFNFGSRVDAMGALTGNPEKWKLDIAASYIAAVIPRLVEFAPNGTVVKSFQFNNWRNAPMNWYNTPWQNISTTGAAVYKTSFHMDRNVSFLCDGCFDQISDTFDLHAISPDFKLGFEYLTSDSYGVLESEPPVPLNALGAELVLTIENWEFESMENFLGVEYLIMQKPDVEIIEDEGARRLVSGRNNTDPWHKSYFHFPNGVEYLGSSGQGGLEEADLDIEIELVNLDGMSFDEVNIDVIGNPIMGAQAAAFFGGHDSSKMTMHRVTVKTMTAGKTGIRIESGFGIGPYPYLRAPQTCTDGRKNNDEVGVDCGGPNCDPCPNGCHFVQSRLCLNCEDGIWNGDETSIDCGGDTCGVNCPNCKNNVLDTDFGEVKIDCGGPNCVDCCQNFKQDPGEDGVDCGGDCATACDGAANMNSAVHVSVNMFLFILSFVKFLI